MLKKAFIFGVLILVGSFYTIPNSRPISAQADQPNIPEAESSVFLPVIFYSQPLMTNYTFENSGLWTVYIPSRWLGSGEKSITSIAIDNDGSIWFGTAGAIFTGDGVYHFDGQRWTHHHPKDGFPYIDISSMAVTSDGAIWFGSFCCGVTRFDGNTWTTYTTENGIPDNSVRSMAAALDGSLWIGTSSASSAGAARFDGENWEIHTEHLSPFVGHIEVLSNNTILFSTSNSFARLVQFDGTNWQEFETPWTANGKYTTDIAELSDGTMWFTTEYLGAYQLVDNTWIHYTTADGLASNETHSVEMLSDNSVWFGTDKGISHFDGEIWETFSTADGLPTNWISAIAIDPDGSLWFGTSGGIIHYQPDH